VSCQPHAQPPSWRTTPCRLSAAAYSVNSQEGVSSIRNLRTRHAVVKRDPPNMRILIHIKKYIYIY
jgi:hypothetical protein